MNRQFILCQQTEDKMLLFDNWNPVKCDTLAVISLVETTLQHFANNPLQQQRLIPCTECGIILIVFPFLTVKALFHLAKPR